MPAPKAQPRSGAAPAHQLELPAKGVVPPPKAAKDIITKGVPAGGAAAGIGFWDWIAAHPWETGGIARWRRRGRRRRLRAEPLAPGAPRSANP